MTLGDQPSGMKYIKYNENCPFVFVDCSVLIYCLFCASITAVSVALCWSPFWVSH
jgi:hypothetical protein